MNQCVNEEMAGCERAEELAIDHMCDPRKWMPVLRVKSRKCPGEPRERNTAIYHWVLLDVRSVIDNDEAMPNHLRVDPKSHYRQTQQDENVGSVESCSVANLESSLPAKTFGVRSSFVACDKPGTFSLLRRSFFHAVCETIKMSLAAVIFASLIAIARGADCRLRLSAPV